MNEPNEQLTPRWNWVANVRFRTLNGIRRWVSNSDRRRRRRRRAERRLSPTSLSVSLLAFTSLDFMTLSHPARTLSPLSSPPYGPAAAAAAAVAFATVARTRASLRVCITSRNPRAPVSFSFHAFFGSPSIFPFLLLFFSLHRTTSFCDRNFFWPVVCLFFSCHFCFSPRDSRSKNAVIHEIWKDQDRESG